MDKESNKIELRKKARNIGLEGLITGFSLGTGIGIVTSYLMLGPENSNHVLNAVFTGSITFAGLSLGRYLDAYRTFRDYSE